MIDLIGLFDLIESDLIDSLLCAHIASMSNSKGTYGMV